VADRTNATDARHEGRHFIKRTALAELLEAAKLSDVEAGFLDPTVFVEMERDLGMAFDARNRIDNDAAALLHEISLLAASFELRVFEASVLGSFCFPFS
jgi:hypothetical protein